MKLLDYAPVPAPTYQPASIDIVTLDTLPVASVPPYYARRTALATWLSARCRDNGGVCYGDVLVLQWEALAAGILFTLDDLRALHDLGILSVLVCEHEGCEPYVFLVWEGDAR